MKSAAVLIILILSSVPVMSMPQDVPKAHPDPCQLKPVVGEKCAVSADFGKCIACIVQNCYAQAMADQGNCDAHKQCINDSVCK